MHFIIDNDLAIEKIKSSKIFILKMIFIASLVLLLMTKLSSDGKLSNNA